MKNFIDFGIEIPSGRSGEIDTTCPQCSHTRKKKTARCLSVNVDKGTWFCAHCGWSGGLGSGAEKPNILHWKKPMYRKPEPVPECNVPEKVRNWFLSRGIELLTLVKNKIGYGPVYMPQIEEKANAISFPYFRGDELINVKYRDGQKNFRMETGAERVLYGLNDISETTVWVEGEIDKLSLSQAGFENCVSVPDGAPTPDSTNYSSKFSFLEADKEKIEAVKFHILAVDNDAPGQRLEDELARRLGMEKCKRVTWPNGCKDANDTLVKFGVDVLSECIREAKPFPINGVFTASDLSHKIEHLYEHGWELGVSTGWAALENLYSVRPGEFTVVTGIPNSGKSNLIDHLIVNLARSQGWNFAIFSPENQPLEDHMGRMMEKYICKPFNKGATDRMTRAERDAAEGWLDEHFHWILPDDDSDWTIETVLDRAAQLVYRFGIRGLVIDPWNELEHARPEGLSETEYVSQALKRIRNFGRRHGVHVWVVAHPSKLYRDKEGNYPVPTMYDISGSAHWRNKADNGLCVWRDLGNKETRVVEVHIQKIRFRQIGKLGIGELIYNKPTGTYHDQRSSPQEVEYA